MSATELACQRHEFRLEPGVHFLNCAYLGPLPRAAEEAGTRGLRRKRCPTDFPSSAFFEDCDRLRERFARLLGGLPERVAILPSVSYGIATTARNLELPPGGKIVVLDEQFPSNVLVWRRLVAERGGRLTVVARPGPPPCGAEWNARILEAIDARTAIVALPHAHWTDGTRIDLAAVSDRAREVGAALVVDASQSLGAVPLEIERVRPDALVCAGYKWLLGPYSISLGYFGERFDDGIPLEETWIAREGSDDFQRLGDAADRYRGGAVRYDVGETSNFIQVPMSIASLDLILAWEPERILAYCRGLLRGLAEDLAGRGWAVEAEPWRSGHMLGVRLPAGWELDTLDERLRRAGVYASLRGDALRVSPNVYNDETDIAALLEVLDAFG